MSACLSKLRRWELAVGLLEQIMGCCVLDVGLFTTFGWILLKLMRLLHSVHLFSMQKGLF
jgi:hypothetical protein